MSLTLKETGAHLLALQEVDSKRRALHHQIETLPQKRTVAALRAKQEEGARRIAQIEARIAEEALKEETAGAALATLETKIAEEQHKIDAATDHREVAALTRELETLATRKDGLESESLGHLQQEEDLELLRIDTEEKVAALAARERAETVAYRQQIAELTMRLAHHDEQRAQIASALPLELQQRYEALAKDKDIAVARFAQGRCLGCGVAPPTGEGARIESSDEVESCPHCHRLLIVSED